MTSNGSCDSVSGDASASGKFQTEQLLCQCDRDEGCISLHGMSRFLEQSGFAIRARKYRAESQKFTQSEFM